jgi:hypothetical protein
MTDDITTTIKPKFPGANYQERRASICKARMATDFDDPAI